MNDRRQILLGLVAALLLSWPVAMLLAQVLPVPAPQIVSLTAQPTGTNEPPATVRTTEVRPDFIQLTTTVMDVFVRERDVVIRHKFNGRWVNIIWNESLASYEIVTQPLETNFVGVGWPRNGETVRQYTEFLLSQEPGYPVRNETFAREMVRLGVGAVVE